jgi:hypothetical protein
MSQQIIFKRGKDTYSTLNAATAAFNLLEWKAGEPAVARYLDGGNTRLLFAIGIADGVGSTNYRVISNIDTVDDLQKIVAQLDRDFTSHEGTMADGTTAGHVINDESSDIEFTDGIAKLKAGSVSLDSLAKSAEAGIIGVKAEDLASGGSASLLTWEEVILELGNQGFKTFNKVKIGDQEIAASSLQDSLEIGLDDNFTVTKSGNKLNISFTAGEAEFNTTLTTASGPIKISGTTDAIVTEFSPTEAVTFPTAPAITGGAVQVGDSADNANSAAIPTVGFVNKKIEAALASNDAMHYRGTFDPTTETLPAGDAGDTYKISVEGEIDGLGLLHVGDMIICNADGTAEGTTSGWDVIEVHSGSLMGPETAVSGNLVVFDSANSVSDSGINASSLVTNSRKVTAGAGLELGSGNGSGTLAADVTIQHAKVELTEENKETGDVVKSIETNEYGHITKVVYGEASKNLELAHSGDGWSGNYIAGGKFINGISLSDNVLTAYATDLPGNVRVASGTTLGFLKDLIIGKTADDLGDNEYAIISAQNSDKLELSVVIDKIDGGTF